MFQWFYASPTYVDTRDAIQIKHFKNGGSEFEIIGIQNKDEPQIAVKSDWSLLKL